MCTIEQQRQQIGRSQVLLTTWVPCSDKLWRPWECWISNVSCKPHDAIRTTEQMEGRKFGWMPPASERPNWATSSHRTLRNSGTVEIERVQLSELGIFRMTRTGRNDAGRDYTNVQVYVYNVSGGWVTLLNSRHILWLNVTEFALYR